MITYILLGCTLYFVVRCLLSGFYTVEPNQRAVVTTFGRAPRLAGTTNQLPGIAEFLDAGEAQRYNYPVVRSVGAGGPYWKWPWQEVHKVSLAIGTINITQDPEKQQTQIDAVTKDNLTIGARGDLRYGVSAQNIYAYLFGVAKPTEHLLGYFVSALRDRIATFEAPQSDADSHKNSGMISVNDLRKNINVINQELRSTTQASTGRYGVALDAVMITQIDPPQEVDAALAAINTTRNAVEADISAAKASADQKRTEAQMALQIASNQAKSEVLPITRTDETLQKLPPEARKQYIELAQLRVLSKATTIITNPLA